MLNRQASELTYAFAHRAVPLRVNCRFLDRYIARFEKRSSFDHVVTVISRIFYFIRGSARVRTGRGARRITPGRFTLLPAGMALPITYERSEFLVYHLHVYDESGQSVFDPAPGIRRLADHSLERHVEKAFRSGDWPRVDALGFDLVMRFLADCLEGIALRHVRTERFHDVIAAVRENPSPRTSVTSLAERFGFSREALSKGFRRATGVPLKDYILDVQLRRARELLTYTDLPASSVAHDLGYEDPSYFFRVFKRLTRMTPGEYRAHSCRERGPAR